MNRRLVIAGAAWAGGLALTASVLFAGCGSSAAPGSAAPTLAATSGHGGHGSSATPYGTEHTPGMVMPDGSTMTAPAPATATSAGPGAEPSATSRMVCAGEVLASVQQLTGMPSAPTTTTSWKDGLFTCTYALPQGDLVLKVKESADDASAKAYFDGLQAGATDPVALDGLEALFVPAFRSPVGIVAFVRDDKTLLVDATALPATVGTAKTERASFAYAVATDVLSCWKDHAPEG